MADGNLIRNPGEIGRRIIDLERKVSQLSQYQPQPVASFRVWYAKVTVNNNDGTYNLTEQILNEAGTDWDDKDGGLTWGGNAADALNAAREINGSSDIAVNTVVIVFINHKQSQAANDWLCVSVSSGGGGTGGATDRSNTVTGGKVTFENDIAKPADASRANINITNVGTVAKGNCAYGGQEESGSSGSEDGQYRHYKWIFNEDTIEDSYHIPMTDSSIVDDKTSFDEINKLWLRFARRKSGKTLEHYLSPLPSSLKSTDAYKCQVTPSGGTKGRVYVAPTSGGSPTIPMDIDRLGWITNLDGTDLNETDDPTDLIDGNTSQTLSQSDYDALTTFYSQSIDYQTNIQDDANPPADTAAFNGANKLIYTAVSSNGRQVATGKTESTSTTGTFVDSTTWNGAGTGGSDQVAQDIYMDFSKIFDGSNISLQNTLIETGSSSSASITTKTIYLDVAYQTDPVSSGVSYNVDVELLDSAGGSPVTFLSNDGTHRIILYEYYDGVTFDPSDANTYFSKNESADITNYTGTKEGARFSITNTFDTSKAGSKIYARAYLEFFAAPEIPPPALVGDGTATGNGIVSVVNAGDYAEGSADITGTAATSTVAADSSTYDSSAANGGADNVYINGVLFRKLADPITISYNLSKGGNTSDFSTDGESATMIIKRGVFSVGFSDDGLTRDDNEPIPIVNDTTDGFDYTVNYIEDSLIQDDSEYLIKVQTPGVSDNPATDTFEFTDNVGQPVWRIQDAYGDLVANTTYGSCTNNGSALVIPDVGTTLRCEGWFLFYANKSDIDGNQLYIDWATTDAPTLVRNLADLRVCDGVIDPVADFGNTGSDTSVIFGAFTNTGALATLATTDTSGNPVSATTTTSVIDLSSFSNNIVTITVWMRDAWNDDIDLELYDLRVVGGQDFNPSGLTPTQSGVEGYSSYGTLT